MSLSHSLSAAEQHNLITNANLTVARFANLVATKLGNKYFFSREDIEDMANEAIMKAWRSIDSYDPTKAKLSTWVSRIAVNCVKDTVGYRMRRMSISGSMYIKTRKKESESGVDEVILDPVVLNTMSENGADGRILQAELKGRICDVVSEMSDKRFSQGDCQDRRMYSKCRIQVHLGHPRGVEVGSCRVERRIESFCLLDVSL